MLSTRWIKLSFRVGDKDNEREDDLPDTFCYGIWRLGTASKRVVGPRAFPIETKGRETDAPFTLHARTNVRIVDTAQLKGLVCP